MLIFAVTFLKKESSPARRLSVRGSAGCPAQRGTAFFRLKEGQGAGRLAPATTRQSALQVTYFPG